MSSARKLGDRLAHQRMIEHLHGDAGAAAFGADAQPLGERRRVHRLDERYLDVRTRFLRDAREGIGERFRAAAALTREHRIEPLRCVDRWRGRPTATDDLADRFLDARDRLLMDAAAPIDHAIDGRGADTSTRRNGGDLGSAFEHGDGILMICGALNGKCARVGSDGKTSEISCMSILHQKIQPDATSKSDKLTIIPC